MDTASLGFNFVQLGKSILGEMCAYGKDVFSVPYSDLFREMGHLSGTLLKEDEVRRRPHCIFFPGCAPSPLKCFTLET